MIQRSQSGGRITINSTVLADEVIDITTTRAGIEERVTVSNTFTGLSGTGGVFGRRNRSRRLSAGGRHSTYTP